MSSGADKSPRRPDLDDIRQDPAPDEVSRDPDSRTRSWKEDQEREEGRLQLENLGTILELRSRYASRLMFLLWVWMVVVAATLLLQGAGWFDLSDAVLVAALSTTSVNIIGLVAIVARYLFPRD